MRFIIGMEVRGYKGRGKGSGFIVWFTYALKGISHVSLIFHFSDGSSVEIESIQGDGVIKHPPKSGPEYEFVTRYVPIRDEQVLWNGFQLASSLVGANYDWPGIWGFMRRKKRESASKWFCSELVAYVLYKMGHALSRRRPFQETPEMCIDSKQLLLTEEEYEAWKKAV